jgi:hypothetical protein
MYVNIGAKTFDNKCRDYKSVITLLVALGELEVNDSYKVGRNTKSYRIPIDKLANGFTTFNSRIKRIRKIEDKTSLLTKSIMHQQKCFKDLIVRDVFISTGDTIKDEIARRELLNVRFGAANIRKGRKVNREFNTILTIPRDARCNLAHKDGIPLYDFDLRACHPFLLLAYCQGQERLDYEKLICDESVDIYNFIAAQAGVDVGAMGASEKEKFRKKLKRGMSRYINGGKFKMCEAFYAKNFPNLNSFIKGGGKGNAKMLQDFESSIMEELGEWCASNGRWYVQQHDGYLSTPADGAIIAEKLKDIVESRIGVRPVVKSEGLNTNDVTNTRNNDNTNTINNTSSVKIVSVGESYLLHKKIGSLPSIHSSYQEESYLLHKSESCPEVVHYQDIYTMDDELAATNTLF